MIIHFKKQISYHFYKEIQHWVAYFNIEIYGPPGTGFVIRRKCTFLDKELYKFIKSVIKEFKSVRFYPLFFSFLCFNGQLKFKFKKPEDEVLFILKYAEGIEI